MSMTCLKIGYFYPDLLNLYGDNGNVEILMYRAKQRGISAEVIKISTNTELTENLTKDINLVFMGGGPDSGQKEMYEDLVKNKSKFLKEYVSQGKTGLFICGAYQLMGHYYKSADGGVLDGLGVFDLYTRHFGNDIPRCIGNTVIKINDEILRDPVFKNVNMCDEFATGFENHGGRTYLQNNAVCFGKVVKGNGNNSEDFTEGVVYKNCIGTYCHGPFLARNPHIADYLLCKALGLEKLDKIEDSLAVSAHTASLDLKK